MKKTNEDTSDLLSIISDMDKPEYRDYGGNSAVGTKMRL